MRPETVLLMRHGRSTWNLQGRLQGQADPPLSWEGVEDVEGVLRRGLPLMPQRVLSSDLRRARDSAAMVAAALGVPHGLDRRLRERSFGLLAGRTRAQLARLPDEIARDFRRDPGAAPPGGESLTAFRARVAAFLADLPAAVRGRPVLVVTHRGVLRMLLGPGAEVAPASVHRLPDRWQGALRGA